MPRTKTPSPKDQTWIDDHTLKHRRAAQRPDGPPVHPLPHFAASPTSAYPIYPINISSHDWSPHFTVFVESGLNGFFAELSNAPLQRIFVPAGMRSGSARR